jgi:hypothetical protein
LELDLRPRRRESLDGHSGRSRMPIDHRDNFEAERLHPKVANWH